MTAPPRTCFATCSLGPPSIPLSLKLKATSAAGFESIELAFPDLVAFASEQAQRDIKEDDYDELAKAAKEVTAKCDTERLSVFMLQPFAHFEGWPEGSPERKDAWDRVRGWMKIMHAAGIQNLQIGSSDSQISFSRSQVVSDLQELADEMQPLGLRIAYENWCWSPHAPSWADAWAIVKAVNRENVGLCLDTFQTAGSEWADPTREDGLMAHPEGKEALDRKLAESLGQLRSQVPPQSIFIYQISDAYRVQPPLKNEVEDGMHPLTRWSHDYRPPPACGGYLPMKELADSVKETGFQGPYSMETFEPLSDLQQASSAEEQLEVMTKYARKAMEGMKTIDL